MERYNITGMSCAACQARVEKAVNQLEGIESCAVNLLTNSMMVEGTASQKEIIQAVEKAGYGASVSSGSNGNDGSDNSVDSQELLENREIKGLKNRLIISVILLIPLMYLSMGHMMWNWPLPGFLEGSHLAMGTVELILTALIIMINRKFFTSGFKALLNRAPNMDSLIALGATASFGYSLYALFATKDMHQLYFESAAMILTLITVGKLLEAKSKGRTTDALKSLMKLAPKTAVLLMDGREEAVSIDRVKPGDRFVLRPGDSIPVDGVVAEGLSAVDESALTGESIPVEKEPGDIVSAGTINTSGYMVCEASRVGEDTTLAGIIRMVSDASATKAPIAKIADKVSGVFVPIVILISIIALVAWLLTGQSAAYAISRAVSVLVISCPCALGLATPVAIMVGNGVAAKAGILFKTATSLEAAGKTEIIAMDKTGTITTGVMEVTDIIPEDGHEPEELLKIAYALEAKSEHPISKALTELAESKGLDLLDSTDFEAVPGKGICAILEGNKIAGGNAAFISKETGASESILAGKISMLASQGKTPIFFARNWELLGIIAVADTVKEDSAKAISELKNMGVHVVMLTGDNRITAEAIAHQAGVDELVAELKPDGKEAIIRELMGRGKVAMVGDGINDAPALARADMGIAIGAGTDIAIDAADIVLMKSSLRDVAAAIRISRATIRNIHQNLFWAFFYNIIGIPLAAGCFVAALGWSLNPMFAAAAMALSSFCVVSNALRLNLVKARDGDRDKALKKPVQSKLINNEVSYSNTDRIKTEAGKEEEMKIKVNGMMCMHCEAHVKKALESIEGIETASASHKDNLVTITTSKEVSEETIKAAVEDAGYEYAGSAEE